MSTYSIDFDVWSIKFYICSIEFDDETGVRLGDANGYKSPESAIIIPVAHTMVPRGGTSTLDSGVGIDIPYISKGEFMGTDNNRGRWEEGLHRDRHVTATSPTTVIVTPTTTTTAKQQPPPQKHLASANQKKTIATTAEVYKPGAQA